MELTPLELFPAVPRVDVDAFPEPLVGDGRIDLVSLVRPLRNRPDLPSFVSFVGSGKQLGIHWPDILAEWRRTLIPDFDVAAWAEQARALSRIAGHFHGNRQDVPVEFTLHYETWTDACLMHIHAHTLNLDPIQVITSLPFSDPVRLQFAARPRSSDLIIRPDSFKWASPDGVAPYRHGLCKLSEHGCVLHGNRIYSGTYREQIGAAPPSPEFASWHQAGIQPILAGKTYQVSRTEEGHLAIQPSLPCPDSRLWAGVLDVFVLRLVRFIREQSRPGQRHVLNEEIAIALDRTGCLVSLSASRHRFAHNTDEQNFAISPVGRWLRSRI